MDEEIKLKIRTLLDYAVGEKKSFVYINQLKNDLRRECNCNLDKISYDKKCTTENLLKSYGFFIEKNQISTNYKRQDENLASKNVVSLMQRTVPKKFVRSSSLSSRSVNYNFNKNNVETSINSARNMANNCSGAYTTAPPPFTRRNNPFTRSDNSGTSLNQTLGYYNDTSLSSSFKRSNSTLNKTNIEQTNYSRETPEYINRLRQQYEIQEKFMNNEYAGGDSKIQFSNKNNSQVSSENGLTQRIDRSSSGQLMPPSFSRSKNSRFKNSKNIIDNVHGTIQNDYAQAGSSNYQEVSNFDYETGLPKIFGDLLKSAKDNENKGKAIKISNGNANTKESLNKPLNNVENHNLTTKKSEDKPVYDADYQIPIELPEKQNEQSRKDIIPIPVIPPDVKCIDVNDYFPSDICKNAYFYHRQCFTDKEAEQLFDFRPQALEFYGIHLKRHDVIADNNDREYF